MQTIGSLYCYYEKQRGQKGEEEVGEKMKRPQLCKTINIHFTPFLS